jgi:predicted protein tyrosine phosphatase
MTDEPSPLQATQKLVNDQIKLLEVVAATGDAVRVAKESAILAAYSRRETGTFTMFQADVISRHLTVLTNDLRESTKVFGENMGLLSSEIRSFSDRADRATRLVAFCTLGIVVVTLLLALTTGALVWVEMKKVEAPRIDVTTPAPKP